MDDDLFWALIDDGIAREGGTGGTAQVAGPALVEVLIERLPPDEVVRFSRHADLVAGRAGTWDLLAACHLVDGWHTDDAFRDFLDFLVLAGRPVLEPAVEHADSLAEHPELLRARRAGRLQPGPVDDLARTAWARLTGDDDEDDWFEAVSAAADESADASGGAWPRGVPWESWGRDEFETRLPGLVSVVGHREA